MTLATNSVSDWLQLVASSACVALLVAAAVGDVLHYRISNRLVGAVVLCFALVAAAQASWGFLGWSLAAAGVTLALAAGLFAFGLFGGGDVKLAAAMALWTQFADLPRFLLVMGTAGGVLGIAWLVRRRMQRHAAAPAGEPTSPIESEAHAASQPQHAPKPPNKLPYGVAIAAGGIDFFLFSANSPLAELVSLQ